MAQHIIFIEPCCDWCGSKKWSSVWDPTSLNGRSGVLFAPVRGRQMYLQSSQDGKDHIEVSHYASDSMVVKDICSHNVSLDGQRQAVPAELCRSYTTLVFITIEPNFVNLLHWGAYCYNGFDRFEHQVKRYSSCESAEYSRRKCEQEVGHSRCLVVICQDAMTPWQWKA